MNWRKTSVDDRSESPSYRRRILEPRIEGNRQCQSNLFSSSSLEGSVTNGRAGSNVGDHCNETRLYENKDEHFRKLSQYCENLQRESSSKKFQWENLFAKSPANTNSKSCMGLKGVNVCDDGDNRGIRVSGSHLGTGSSFKDNLQGNNLGTSNMKIGGIKDTNVNNRNISRNFAIDDCSHLSSSRNFHGPVYETIDVVRVQDRPIFQSAEKLQTGRRYRTSTPEKQASHLHSSAHFTESKGIWQDYEGHLPLSSTDYSNWKKEKHRKTVETQVNMEELTEYKRTQANHIEQFKDCNQYFEVQPCKRNEIGAAALNSSFSQQQMVRIPQNGFYHDSTRTSVVMDPFVEGFEDTESYVVSDMEETQPRDDYDYLDEVLGSGTGCSMKGEREAYISREKLVLAEEDGYRTNYGKWSHEDKGLNGSLASNHEQDLSDMEDSRELRWNSAHSTKSMVKGTRCGVQNHRGSDSCRKPNVFSRIQFPSHGGENDIVINLNHGSQHPPKSKHRDLKKRLGVRDSMSNSNPQLIEQECKANKRLRQTNVDHSCFDVQASDCFEEKTQSSSSGLKAEDPSELNHLIKNAFFKFVKVLSESPARRKKFLEPGCGIIKCFVCGSKSKEFEDSLSLSEHAFLSLEGSRAEHLGLHKALCWLMGWSSEASPNGLWVPRELPLAEVLALKDDLIIWPPVLIIHNTSELVTISCEELEVVIRGKGCGGKIKVGHGKPGNQSIMVAIFSAMFSGLQGAERLHKGFADKSRGREEFQKIKSSHLVDGDKNLHKATRESLLYGYLGLAEDLDKLDFETKKRSVVKSKKEIQAIMEASLHC